MDNRPNCPKMLEENFLLIEKKATYNWNCGIQNVSV